MSILGYLDLNKKRTISNRQNNNSMIDRSFNINRQNNNNSGNHDVNYDSAGDFDGLNSTFNNQAFIKDQQMIHEMNQKIYQHDEKLVLKSKHSHKNSKIIQKNLDELKSQLRKRLEKYKV